MCQLVHLDAGHVETVDGRVTVCRDAAKGRCFRPLCKFYHIPVSLPPAGEIARAYKHPAGEMARSSPEY